MLELQHLNLAEILEYRATEESGTAEQMAFTFLQDGENVSDQVTYRELADRAQQVARHLQTVSRPGDRVLLLYPPSIDYIAAFFACICAGRVAVPAFPPGSARHLSRLRMILEDAEAHVALCSATTLDRVRYYEQGSEVNFDDLVWLVTDTLPAATGLWQPPAIALSDIAFLQYTSGSTGAPKGVMLAHENLLANIFYGKRAHHRPSPAGTPDIGVGWLPPYHDFGLIAGIIGPVCAGAHSIHMPPFVFLMQPYLWLKALSKYKARVTGAPNFAFELCTRKINAAQKKLIDLSALEIVVNGAEPIRMQTLRRFAKAFAECGFNPRAIAPGYGLAESTLLVTANIKNYAADGMPGSLLVSRTALGENRIARADPDNTEDFVELVSVGSKLPDHHVAIVDPVTHARLAPWEIGEIWVRGPSVARGYRNRPAETAAAFGARIEGEGEPWLRTGDLGFLADEELYITGRIKEVMIFSGRNVYPQDIEATVETLDRSFRPMSCAAFAIEREAGCDLVVVQEVEFARQPVVEGLAARIRGEIDKQHTIFNVAALLLVKAGALPRTTSGKIQRLLCREMFQHGQFSALWEWRRDAAPASGRAAPERSEAANATERRLVEIFKEALGIDQIGVSDNFLSLGGDSILAIQIISRAAQSGIHLAAKDIFQCSTIAELAAVARLTSAIVAEQGPLTGPCPLTPAQRSYLAATAGGDISSHPALRFELTQALPSALLASACRALLEHHDALRLRFADNQPASHAPVETATLELPTIDLSQLDAAAQAASLERERHRLCTSLDPAHGPRLKALHFILGEGREQLLLAGHRLVLDTASWRLLGEDLDTACRQLLAGQAITLPAKTSACRQWAERLAELPEPAATADAAGFWPPQESAAPRLPRPALAGATKRERLTRHLDATATENLLKATRKAYRLRPEELLLTALLRTLCSWLEVDRLSLLIDHDGRHNPFPELDISRTVGWLHSPYPLCLERPAEDDGAALKAVKEQWRAVPAGGLGYALLSNAARARPPELPIAFHYAEPPATPATLLRPLELTGPATSAIDVTADWRDDGLELIWQYDPDRLPTTTVVQLADHCLDQVHRLLAHCRRAPAGATRGDFPLAALDAGQVDRLTAAAASAGEELQDIYPLTDAQRDMLEQSVAAPGAGIYAEQFSCTLAGGLDCPALERALGLLFEHHPVLRSAAVEISGALTQQAVYGGLPLPLRHEDWRGIPEEERAGRLEHCRLAERLRPFELTRPPLSRLLLIRYSADLYQFVWTYHHAFFDGWSLALLLQEFLALYGALTTQRPAEYPPARPFRDYLGWLAKQPAAPARAYWQRCLAGLSGPTRLASRQPLPDRQGSGSATWELDSETSGGLARLARQHGFTPSTLMQGVWALLLGHYSGQREVVFGATFSSRPPELSGIENMVGMFTNDLPIRVRIDSAGRCTDWLQALQAQCTELRAFEHTPQRLIQECSGLAAGEPLFESVVAIQNFPIDPSLLLVSETLPVWSTDFAELSHYPLLFSVDIGGSLEIRVTYTRQGFTEATIAALLADIEGLLRALLATPTASIEQLLATATAGRRS